jgi:hypothetical protein
MGSVLRALLLTLPSRYAEREAAWLHGSRRLEIETAEDGF